MKTRSAFFASSDPMLTLYSLHHFYEYYQDEIDKLYVVFNSEVSREIVNTLSSLIKHPKVVFTYISRTMGHGEAIRLFLDQCEEDKLVLLEDDAVVFRKGVLNRFFDLIPQYSLIGSPRMSCTPVFAEEAKKEFNLNYEGWGDRGPNFWPCYLYITKELLQKTNSSFGQSALGDTFVATSLELRRLIGDQSKILEIPQYHLGPDDAENKQAGRGIFDGHCDYIHVGSLSTGIENSLLDEENIPLKYIDQKVSPAIPKAPETEQERKEIEKRIIWWRKASEHVFRTYGEVFGPFGEKYRRAMGALANRSQINRGRLNATAKMYEELMRN